MRVVDEDDDVLGEPVVVLARRGDDLRERRVIAAFAPWDAVLTPTTALTPRPLDWYPIDDGAADFDAQVLHTPHTSFVNLTGLPALSLPVHQTDEGLPMSCAPIGRQLERRIPWTQRVVDRMAA